MKCEIRNGKWGRGGAIARVVVLCLLSFPGVGARAGIVSGINTTGTYGLYNGLYQWEFGDYATNCQQIGKVALGTGGFFGYDIQARDIAMLSNHDVAITHVTTGGVAVISILRPLYNRHTGAFTNVTLVKTITPGGNVTNPGEITPLPNLGFVTKSSTWLGFYKKPRKGTWQESEIQGSGDAIFHVAGLTNPDRDEVALMMRQSSQYRFYRYSNSAKLATYTNAPFYQGGYMEGVVSTNLLTNGWVTSCLEGWSDDGPTVVWDSDPDTQTDGGNYSGVKGEMTNGDGSVIDPVKPVACLEDGRIVLHWSGGFMRDNTTFRVYELVKDPGGRTGTIGANGELFEVTLGGSSGTFVGRIAGDYQYVPPPPKGTVVTIK